MLAKLFSGEEVALDFCHFQKMELHSTKRPSIFLLEFFSVDSALTYSRFNLCIKSSTKSGRNAYEVNIFGKYAEPKEARMLGKSTGIHPLSDGNNIRTVRLDAFVVGVDKLYYRDRVGLREIPFKDN